jgi:hypothetical protein
VYEYDGFSHLGRGGYDPSVDDGEDGAGQGLLRSAAWAAVRSEEELPPLPRAGKRPRRSAMVSRAKLKGRLEAERAEGRRQASDLRARRVEEASAARSAARAQRGLHRRQSSRLAGRGDGDDDVTAQH